LTESARSVHKPIEWFIQKSDWSGSWVELIDSFS